MVTELRSREYKVGCASGFVSIGWLRFSLMNVGWLFLKLCEYKVAGFRFGECGLAVFLFHGACLKVYMSSWVVSLLLLFVLTLANVEATSSISNSMHTHRKYKEKALTTTLTTR